MSGIAFWVNNLIDAIYMLRQEHYVPSRIDMSKEAARSLAKFCFFEFPPDWDPKDGEWFGKFYDIDAFISFKETIFNLYSYPEDAPPKEPFRKTTYRPTGFTEDEAENLEELLEKAIKGYKATDNKDGTYTHEFKF